MRPIKFRAWDLLDRCMLDWGTIRQTAFNRGNEQLMYRLFTSNDERIILMQFTGLLDKNGKEIYEGDIVSLFPEQEHTSLGTVIIDKSGVLIEADTWLNKRLYMYAEKTEVIGNIYENPELLK